MRDLDSLLRRVAEQGGSDLHLKVGAPPKVRVDGILHPIEGQEPLAPEETQSMARSIMDDQRWAFFLERNEADLAYGLKGVARFRVNVFRQRGSISLVMRLVTIGSPTIEDLGLPSVVDDLTNQQRGLILVTGPTGSGKTTTLAAMIDRINRNRACHIVTIEDPIEVVHPDQISSVAQREVGVDTESFITAMRAAMRQDPDVILIGEMRDPETVQAALAAAETGHLVLSTLHTIDATESVNRIVDFFPPFQQQQVRVTLAGALRAILCQRLVTRKGGGRVPAIEVMINNGRTAERILDPTRTQEIEEIVAEGGFYGMQTFDQSLLDLVRRELVEVPDALDAASNRHDFELAMQQAGLVTTIA
jgi:twitching motility protein PilT